MLGKFNNFSIKLLEVISMFALLLMTTCVSWQVLGRYIMTHAPAWTLSVSLLAMTYMILFMIAVGVHKQFHLQLWILLDRLSPKSRHYVLLFQNIIILAFAICFFVYGIKLTIMTWSQTIPVLNIPGGVNYIAFAISGFFMIFYALENLLSTKE